MEGRERAAARGVGVDLDAVADGVGGPEGEDGFRGITFFGYDAREEFLRIGVELGGFDADDFVFEDVRETAVEFPRAERGAPVDELDEFVEVERWGLSVERLGREDAGAGECGHGDIDGGPVEGLATGAGFGEGSGRLLRRSANSVRWRFLFRGDVGEVGGLLLGGEEGTTTLTTREASRTWMTPDPYSGAIFTAVCAGLVVAPPMKRSVKPGASFPWRRGPSRRGTA